MSELHAAMLAVAIVGGVVALTVVGVALWHHFRDKP